MDTSVMAYTAEDLISHKLQRSGLIVAKPKFDQDGTDLLVLLNVGDGAKFCRVQCKGRSLINSEKTNVSVPKGYVTDAFILFLFVETGHKDDTHLFCFMANEIRNDWSSHKDNYKLLITKGKLTNDLLKFVFNENKIKQIIKAIMNVNVEGEFKKIATGFADITLGGITVQASGTVTNPAK